MSVIYSQRPLSAGIDTATLAIRTARGRFAAAAEGIARQGVALSQPVSAKEPQGAKSTAPKPPNPGPPGGAQPGDLAEAFVAQNMAVHELKANVKTVQAFSEMLEELTRLKK
jgi:hypothetical protein